MNSFAIWSAEAPGLARREEGAWSLYATDEQRSQAGWIGAPDGEAIHARALRGELGGEGRGERSEEALTLRQARRLALARAGLLAPTATGLPASARGRGRRARAACHRVIERFGYLQLDSIPVSGARTHAIVLASRLPGLDASLAETLLAPGEPLFEYWGHEASWLPMSLYPSFAFRRRDFRIHPWWGDLLGEHRALADAIVDRIAREGPLRSMDLEGESGKAMWHTKLASRVAEALWSAGVLAVRERRGFLRHFDLSERVIPESVRSERVDDDTALETLLLKALEGHGWATTGTLAATWRLRNMRPAVDAALARLVERARVVPCALESGKRRIAGWVRPDDLDALPELERLRPRRARGVLLSPFDPVLWDRGRVQTLFGFEQVLEIYKPAHQRRYGYYCLPVLGGDGLVARVDLKADRDAGTVRMLACHYERAAPSGRPAAHDAAAVRSAFERFAAHVGLADGGTG